VSGTRRTLGAVAAGALLLVLGLAACGSGGGDDGDGVASLGGASTQAANQDAASGSEDPQDRALEFARCMRKHGIDFPDPDANGRLTIGPRAVGGDRQKFEDAQKACGGLFRGGGPQLSDEQRQELQEAALAFARCMREHGVDMPDPQFEGGGVMQRGPRNVNPNDEKVQEAQKACEPIIRKSMPGASLESRS
jgi:hypothetical protein